MIGQGICDVRSVFSQISNIGNIDTTTDGVVHERRVGLGEMRGTDAPQQLPRIWQCGNGLWAPDPWLQGTQALVLFPICLPSYYDPSVVVGSR